MPVCGIGPSPYPVSEVKGTDLSKSRQQTGLVAGLCLLIAIDTHLSNTNVGFYGISYLPRKIAMFSFEWRVFLSSAGEVNA